MDTARSRPFVVRVVIAVVISVAASTSACGSSGGGGTSGASEPDGGACVALPTGTTSGPSSCVAASASSCPSVYALAAASTDYQSSGLATLATNACDTRFASGLDLGGDPALASSNGHTYWLDRTSGNLFPLDECGAPHGTIALDPDHDQLDPQDVAVDASCSLWIPYFLAPRLEVRGADGTVQATIDLSSYDADGNPDASAVAVMPTSRGEETFVTLEELDTSPTPMPESVGKMLVVDVSTAKPVDVVNLAGRNPFGRMVVAGGHLYIAEPGTFMAVGEAEAGVERFDPETHTGTLVATESALGGSVVEVAVSSDEACAAAIVADASSDNRTSLVAFDLGSGQVTQTLLPPTSGYDLDGLGWVQADAELLVGDRSGHGPYAVHAFQRGTGCALTEQPDAIFLPQAPLAFHAVTH